MDILTGLSELSSDLKATIHIHIFGNSSCCSCLQIHSLTTSRQETSTRFIRISIYWRVYQLYKGTKTRQDSWMDSELNQEVWTSIQEVWPAGNRFVFRGGDNGISCNQPTSVVMVLGKNSLFEMSGSQHKLIRGAITNFLKPESIQRFVAKMDSLVQQQLFKVGLESRSCSDTSCLYVYSY